MLPVASWFVRPGMNEQVRHYAEVAANGQPPPGWDPELKDRFKLRLAGVDGNYREAARQLKNMFDSPGAGAPIVYALFIANAAERAGDDAFALDLIEKSDPRPAQLYIGSFSFGGYWHKLRYERARLLRKKGRTAEAASIEADLLQRLRLADPDHPALTRLRESQRRPFDVY